MADKSPLFVETVVRAFYEVEAAMAETEEAAFADNREGIKAGIQKFMQAGPLAVAKILKALGEGGVVQSSVTVTEKQSKPESR